MKTRTPAPVEPRSPDRVTTRTVLRDLAGTVSDFTITPLRTFVSLAKRPGRVIRDYLFGNRDEVSGPGRTAFIGVSLFLLVNSAVSSELSAMFDPLVWWQQFWPYVAPVLLVPIAALQRRMFRSHGLSFGETFSFGLFLLGEIAVFRAVLLGINYLTGIGDVGSSEMELVRDGIIVLAEALYMAWATADLYADRRPRTWLKGAFLYGTFATLTYGILAGIVYYVFRGLLT